MKRIGISVVLAALLAAGAAPAQVLTTLYDINNGNIPEDTQVRVEGIVVTGVAWNGCYVQEEAGGPFSGIWIYTGNAAPGTAVGDLINVEGLYYEYYAFSEIEATPAQSGVIEVVGSGYNPAPQVVRAVQIRTSNPVEAEKWESVLVRVFNVARLALDPGYGEWFAAEYGYADNDTLRLDDQFTYGLPDIGAQLVSVTGVLRYNFDDFKLEPRGNDDIIYQGGQPAPNLDYAVVTAAATVDVRFDRDVDETSAENVGNYFLDVPLSVAGAVLDPGDATLVHLTLSGAMTPALLVTLTAWNVENVDGVPMEPQNTQFWGGINTVAFANLPDAGGDSSAVAGDVITVRAVVHSIYDVNSTHFYVQDVGGGQHDYNGLEVYASTLIGEVAIGDIVVIGDVLSEYYNQTSLTEPFLYFHVESHGNPVQDPDVFAIDGGNYELWEGALVEVQNVTVVERGNYDNYYEFSVTQDELNWLKVGDMGVYDYLEGLGDILNIRGTLRWDFGEFKLMPRSDDDIDIIYQNPIAAPAAPAAPMALAQNYPNPFNPATTIVFNLGTAGPVRLEVFDMQGRLIRVLHDGPLAAGNHRAEWRGETDQGGAAPSGLYAYRLSTAAGAVEKKMLLLK